MQRTISLLALLALLSGLLPPATCLGIGRACCCASPIGAPGASSGVVKPALEPAALTADESTCRCACAEMSAGATDPPPATRAASPTPLSSPPDVGLAARSAAPAGASCLTATAHLPADPDPPPTARLALRSVLRI
jgi:hypothetical protein